MKKFAKGIAVVTGIVGVAAVAVGVYEKLTGKDLIEEAKKVINNFENDDSDYDGDYDDFDDSDYDDEDDYEGDDFGSWDDTESESEETNEDDSEFVPDDEDDADEK